VQEKAAAFPADAKLCQRARLVRLAKRHGVRLRQTYARVGKFALIKHQRYAHARQFKRAARSLRTLKTYLGRVIRDIERAIVQKPALNEAAPLCPVSSPMPAIKDTTRRPRTKCASIPPGRNGA
jgi:IS5 family transposase